MEKFEKMKNKTKDFLHRNERKIKIGVNIGIGVATVVGTGALIIDNRNKRIQLKNKDEVIGAMSEKILELKGLCEEKDKFFMNFISNLLRQGNSEGARQMVYRRYYLEKNK